MIKWLTALGGVEILAIWGLSLAVGAGYSYHKGGEHKANEIAAKTAKQDDKLDKASDNLGAVTDKIVNGLENKISVRVDGVKTETTKAIKDAALEQGRLEGKVAGYIKGFEDAANLPNTCYSDPRFLSDSVRLGAESRYRAIFGPQGPDRPPADGPNLRGTPPDALRNNAPD